MSCLIYRTLLQLDNARHEISNTLLLCSVDEDCSIEVLTGLAVDTSVRTEQLKAFNQPPLGFVLRGNSLTIPEGSRLYSNGELGGINIEAESYEPPSYIVYEFTDYSPEGIYRYQKPNDPNMSLTIGCCRGINRIFNDHGAQIPFPKYV